MNQTVKNTLNPKHPAGGYALPYAPVLIVLGLVVAFLAGAFTAHHLDRNYYASHYQAPLKAPGMGAPVKVPPRIAAAVPDAAGIYFRFFNTQSNDQGTDGSCEAWSAAKQVSYAYNSLSPFHYRLYSPRFLYDAVSNCQDNGSYLEQFPPVITNQGVPTWSQFPYGPNTRNLPDYAVDCPTPGWAQTLARLHRLGVSETLLFPDQGAGPGGLDLIHQALARHEAVNVDFPVFTGYDQANADGSTVNLPTPGQLSRGGHANTDVRLDSHHNNGNGTYGADLFSNQWSKYAGVGRDGIRHAGPHNGYVWVSWDFIERYVWGAAVLHVAQGSPGVGKMLSADGGTSQRHLPPYTFQKKATHELPPHAAQLTPPTSPADARKVGLAWDVQNVIASNGQDISSQINAWGNHYHVWPLGIAATVGTESGYNIYARRWQYGLDKSCGLLQQIVTNVEPIIGNYDPEAACRWEYNPSNSIYLGARLYAEYFAYQHGCVQWTQAYGMYNAGPGWPCSFYYNLTGVALANYEGNFLPNYYWAVQHFQSFNPPAPPPRPIPKPIHHNTHHYSRASWCRSARSHRLRCPSAFYGHHLSTVAFQWVHWHHAFHGKRSLNSVCGGVISRESWDARNHIMWQRFAHCGVHSWPETHGDPTEWVHLKTWKPSR